MRKWRKEVLRRLGGIEKALARRTNEVKLLQGFIDTLQDEKNDLKDRLMSRDFEQLQIYRSSDEDKDLNYLGEDYGMPEGEPGEIINLSEAGKG